MLFNYDHEKGSVTEACGLTEEMAERHNAYMGKILERIQEHANANGGLSPSQVVEALDTIICKEIEEGREPIALKCFVFKEAMELAAWSKMRADSEHERVLQ